MRKTVLVPSLRRWGLSADADLVYRTLVSFGPHTASQAARELGLAVRRVRQAFDELAAVNAAQPRRVGASNERTWVPAPVDRVLAGIRRRRRHDTVTDRWRRHLAAVNGVDRFLIDNARVRHLATRALARQRIAQLAAAEQYEHLALNTEEVFSADAMAAARPLDTGLRNRGLRLRSIGLTPSDGDRALAHDTDLGDEYREADTLPLKLMIFDRRVAVFPADPLDFDAGAIEVADPAVIDWFSGLFHTLWAAARDPRSTGVAPIVLTPREIAIVTLLARGYSEEAVAEEIRLSRRTVLYALRALMDRLGVENRFQLAMIVGAARAVPLPGNYAPEEQQ